MRNEDENQHQDRDQDVEMDNVAHGVLDLADMVYDSLQDSWSIGCTRCGAEGLYGIAVSAAELERDCWGDDGSLDENHDAAYGDHGDGEFSYSNGENTAAVEVKVHGAGEKREAVMEAGRSGDDAPRNVVGLSGEEREVMVACGSCSLSVTVRYSVLSNI